MISCLIVLPLLHICLRRITGKPSCPRSRHARLASFSTVFAIPTEKNGGLLLIRPLLIPFYALRPMQEPDADPTSFHRFVDGLIHNRASGTRLEVVYFGKCRRTESSSETER